MRWPGTIAIALVVAARCAWAEQAEPPRPTAILGAMGKEVALLISKLDGAQVHRVHGMRFTAGELRGRDVVVAQSGVGKVNAAIAATLLIERFSPREVIFTGIAGGLGPNVLPGDIVIAGKTVQHDLGTVSDKGMKNWAVRNPATGKRNPLHIPGDPRLLALAQAAAAQVKLRVIATSKGDRAPKVVRGTVATGDVFVASGPAKAAIRERLGADAVEMEGAAVAQVCWQLGVPCLVVRSISDLADANASRDYKRFAKIAAENSATLVMEMLGQMAARPLE